MQPIFSNLFISALRSNAISHSSLFSYPLGVFLDSLVGAELGEGVEVSAECHLIKQLMQPLMTKRTNHNPLVELCFGIRLLKSRASVHLLRNEMMKREKNITST